MSKKDVPRGTANCRVFDPTDDSHIERTTPLQTKRKQMLAAEDAGIDAKREASTTRKRMNKEVKPI